MVRNLEFGLLMHVEMMELMTPHLQKVTTRRDVLQVHYTIQLVPEVIKLHM